MKKFLSVFLIISGLLILPAAARAGSTGHPPELDIDWIMQGEKITGTPPTVIGWSTDGKRLYFRWRRPGETQALLYALNPRLSRPLRISEADMRNNPPEPRPIGALHRFSDYAGRTAGPAFDRQRSRALLVRKGDIYLVQIRKGKSIRLTATDEPESAPRFTLDGKNVVFIRGQNLFRLSLGGAGLRQLTSFTHEKIPADEPPGPEARWYREQQKHLFKHFSAQSTARERAAHPLPGKSGTSRRPFHLADNQSLAVITLSGDETRVVFILREKNRTARPTMVPDFVTPSGYTEPVISHPKAGETLFQTRAGIADTTTGEITWIDFGPGGRQVNPTAVYWSPDGRTCLLTAESTDRKDTWLLQADLDTGRAAVIEHVHDDAWIGGYGLFNLVWSPSGESIYYLSEKNGFSQLYRASLDSAEIERITDGLFEIQAADLSRDGRTWYLTSNEEHPGERHFYSMPLAGGTRTRITSATGRHSAFPSPDGRHLAVLFSTPVHPAELFLMNFAPGSAMKRITLSTPEEFRARAWHNPRIITFPARDGAAVSARLFLPENPHPLKPAVIFIHGAGYLQNAHKGWSHYFREYMFHNFLMEHGYTVMDVDYRGSAGYGRDCRTAIYRRMGGRDLDDIEDAARYLVEKHGIEKRRIGIYGGSYGGFLTLMGMFTRPETFAAGAALRPVTDWAHYSPGYTVDILNLPRQDAEAYQQSSPIHFAEGLEGALLICHGMMDVNVHFQDTARLTQRLIDLGKEGWETAIYPIEGHGFRNAASWADEYKRIFKLFEAHLK